MREGIPTKILENCEVRLSGNISRVLRVMSPGLDDKQTSIGGREPVSPGDTVLLITCAVMTMSNQPAFERAGPRAP